MQIKGDCINRFLKDESRNLEVPFFGSGTDAPLFERTIHRAGRVRFTDISISNTEVSSLIQNVDATTVFSDRLDDSDIISFFPPPAVFTECLRRLTKNPSQGWRLAVLRWKRTPRSVWMSRNNLLLSTEESPYDVSKLFPNASISSTLYELTFDLPKTSMRQLLAASKINLSRDEEIFSFVENELGWSMRNPSIFIAVFEILHLQVESR